MSSLKGEFKRFCSQLVKIEKDGVGTSEPVREEKKPGAELEREAEKSDDTIVGDHESEAELENMPEEEPQAQEAPADLNTPVQREPRSLFH